MLAFLGGAFLFGSGQAPGRVLGTALAIGGAVLLVRNVSRVRSLLDRVLDAIPFQDKSEVHLSELPRAWSRMQEKVVDLEAALAREDILRWNILSNLRTGLILFRRSRKVRLFNPSAKALLGSSSHLGVGSVLEEVFREPESLKAMETAFRGGISEWVLKRHGRIMQVRAVPFEGQTEGVQDDDGVLVTVADVTRQEALETTRQKFISNASHELKTPTTSIRIAAEDLLEGHFVQPEGETSLRIILRSVDRMTMLLNDISELSRIETGALTLEPVRIRVGTFLEDLVEDAAAQAQGREVTLLAEIPPSLQGTTFKADPYRLHQLLENLLSNAIKFSHAGSSVKLSVGLDGHDLLWRVEDHGPGIPQADLARIFERFYRSPLTRAIPGTGLGLAIVKHLALLMHGEVSVASEVGQGSTFTLRLPLTDS